MECPLCKTTKRELVKLQDYLFGCPICYYFYDKDGNVSRFSKQATFTNRKRIYGNLSSKTKP